MEVKKSKHVQLENKRGTWLLMGIIVVLAFLFVAFEWAQYDKEINYEARVVDPIFTGDMIPITFPTITPPPPPPASTVIADIIEVVTNDVEVSETEVPDSEDNNNPVMIDYTPGDFTGGEASEVEEVEIFTVVEAMPEFPGGDAALLAYMKNNMKYPSIPQEQGIQGRVIIQFIVDKDGTITDPTVVRGVDPYLDKEAMRVIKGMPKWTPGMQRKVPVRVKYTLPVTFRLQ
ncbi:energy transducer TonB [Bacteroides sp. 224]|uniref:energy transducer TonB n=1 Tax=Bacteroides sp. 224 TaxID=2302936 RepID=UPI0013D5702C|nr:energy transducer TonB [Bacteroides sp. 224]NDV63798.1 energy transducer TonB [Bacteroides sp. 224]